MSTAIGILLVIGGLWSLLSLEHREERVLMCLVVVLGAALLLK